MLMGHWESVSSIPGEAIHDCFAVLTPKSVFLQELIQMVDQSFIAAVVLSCDNRKHRVERSPIKTQYKTTPDHNTITTVFDRTIVILAILAYCTVCRCVLNHRTNYSAATVEQRLVEGPCAVTAVPSLYVRFNA